MCTQPLFYTPQKGPRMSDERVLKDMPVIGRIDLHEIERTDPLPSERFAQAIEVGLTFDDVLLRPAKSDIHPNFVEVGTQLTRDIRLNIPIISSAMDTVTEARLAIAMAQQGGLGIVHKNMPIDAQAEEVDKVKRSEAGMIVDPVTMRPWQTITEALQVMAKYKISGVPVTDANGKLVGILTNRDLRFETRFDLPIAERMTKENLITVPVGTTLEQAREVLHHHRIEKLLVVDSNGDLKGLITVKDIQKARRYPLAAKHPLGRLRCGAAIGIGRDGLDRARALIDAKVDVVVIDSSHAHSTAVLDTIRQFKKLYPSTPLIAGNVATYEGARDLIELGVDAVKVGIGPGSIGAMQQGSKDRYFQEETDEVGKLVPEGIEGKVPYKGSLSAMIPQLIGGLRSGMGLTGSKSVEDLRTKSQFVRITAAGLRESHAHDVVITKEAPNYRIESTD